MLPKNNKIINGVENSSEKSKNKKKEKLQDWSKTFNK